MKKIKILIPVFNDWNSVFKLVDNIDYEDQETFAQKVATVKESYFKTNKVTGTDEIEEDDSPAVEVSGSMDQYLKAIKKTAK